VDQTWAWIGRIDLFLHGAGTEVSEAVSRFAQEEKVKEKEEKRFIRMFL
jgi:hypothetical protein